MLAIHPTTHHRLELLNDDKNAAAVTYEWISFSESNRLNINMGGDQ